MKINEKILSIPPYISTSWDHVRTLHVKANALVISLKEGDIITIPNLSQEIISSIFSAHAAYLEHKTEIETGPEQSLKQFSQLFNPEQGGESAFRIGFNNPDALGSVLQHNPAQRDAPLLPPQILEKIAAVAKIIAPEAALAVPQPEEGCNCIHCQIARALNQALHPVLHTEEEEISAEDLSFRQWDIVQTGDKLFTVTNPLDTNEKYNVFLGNPIGCTCGQPNCEHIIAVLKT